METIKNTLYGVTDVDIIDGKFIVPDDVTELACGAFEGRKTLKNIDLSYITHIGL